MLKLLALWLVGVVAGVVLGSDGMLSAPEAAGLGILFLVFCIVATEATSVDRLVQRLRERVR